MTTQLSFGYLQPQQTAVTPRRRICDLPLEERRYTACLVMVVTP